MFDWLYKQANLQSMCSITSLAMPPEYQHDLAEVGRRGWPPANRHSHGLGAGTTGGLRAKGQLPQRHLRPPLDPLWAFCFRVPVSPSQRGREQNCPPAGSGLWCKAPCGIKDETPLCCTGMTRMRYRHPA